MDGIESAIRGALARGDARDRAFRERVYRSVFAALERKLAEAPGMTEAVAQRQREALKQRIVLIEREFVPQAPAPAPPVDNAPQGAPEVEAVERAPPVVAVERRAEPVVAPAVEVHPRRAVPPPLDDGGEGGGLVVHPRREMPAGDMTLPGVAGDMRAVDEAEAERRRPWGLLLIAATLVAILGIGGWWAVETGFFGRDDGSVPNPPTVIDDEDYSPDEPPPLNQGGSSELDWVTVFSAADAEDAVATSGATVEPMAEEEGRPFLRLRSRSAAAPVNIRLDGAALAAAAGGPVVFNIVARAQEGQETQISVACDFGAMGDCGRRRYLVGLHISDFLFDVELGEAGSGSAGLVSIVTDVDGTGKAMDLFEIRLAPVE